MENVSQSNYLCACVGYAFVPIQYLNKQYPVDKALAQGTIFPELDLSISEYGEICKEEVK